jgi:hypothetical protein
VRIFAGHASRAQTAATASASFPRFATTRHANTKSANAKRESLYHRAFWAPVYAHISLGEPTSSSVHQILNVCTFSKIRCCPPRVIQCYIRKLATRKARHRGPAWIGRYMPFGVQPKSNITALVTFKYTDIDPSARTGRPLLKYPVLSGLVPPEL